MYILKKLIKFFSKTEIFCINIIIFILILIIGTVIQKYIGIESAQELYFGSAIIWVNNIFPLPGGGLILFLIFLGLSCKLINIRNFLSKISSLIIHLSMLFFLLGAFLTNKFSIEGTIVIQENEKINYFINKKNYSLNIIVDKSTKYFDIIENRKIMIDNINIKNLNIKIKNFYKNININLNNKINTFFEIMNIPSFPESEYDKAGIFILIDENGKKKHLYLIENLPYKIYDDLILIFNKTHTILPFEMKLINFEKKMYLKSNMAKAYNSLISINYKNNEWKTNIKMNKPLRLYGYTFYQTSFIEENDINSSVFTVVNNPGNYILYIASIINFLGLLFHIFKIKFKN